MTGTLPTRIKGGVKKRFLETNKERDFGTRGASARDPENGEIGREKRTLCLGV